MREALEHEQLRLEKEWRPLLPDLALVPDRPRRQADAALRQPRVHEALRPAPGRGRGGRRPSLPAQSSGRSCPVFEKLSRESARTMSPWRHEWRVEIPGRGEVWIECHTMPVQDSDGALPGTAASTMSRSAREESALKESELRFRADGRVHRRRLLDDRDRAGRARHIREPAVERCWGITPKLFYEEPRRWLELVLRRTLRA